MKKLFLIIILLINVSVSIANWRPNEMEVKVYFDNQEEFALLQEMRLNGDLYRMLGYGILYLIPSELEQVRAANLRHEILKSNLIEYYQDFWLQRDEYHSYAQIIALMDSLVNAFPDICVKINFGTSLGNRQLAALKISDNVSETEFEPTVIFDGGIHGDEVGGPENLIRLAREMCIGYGTDSLYTYLINNRQILLYVMVNPDGRVNMSRYNNNGIDVNRDCGYMWDAEGGSPDAFSQVETKALRECVVSNPAVIHITYHSGTQNILYLWGYRYDATPDNTHHTNLANLYASSSGYSNLLVQQGSQMYIVNGATDDAAYGFMGTMSYTMEISNNKQPAGTQINYYYQANKSAMLTMLEEAEFGVSGTVTDAVTGKPINDAMVFVNSYYPAYANSAGAYFKYLLPGTYSITIKANGYETQTIDNISVTANSNTITDFTLTPAISQFGHKFVSSRIPNNNSNDPGNTYYSLSAPDMNGYSIGKNGWCVIDMQYPVNNNTGNDIKVYESDEAAEGYSCYAGNSPYGPWTLLGTGLGTTEFDLQQGNLTTARYIKIVDDNNGLPNVFGAGFDLDAVEALQPVLPASMTLNIAAGWNAVSINIIPENTSIEDMFEGNTQNIKIIKNNSGQIYIPEYNINTILNWDYNRGYTVFAYNDFELNLNGWNIYPEMETISLSNGWNLISYLKNNEITPQLAFANILQNLIIVKDIFGNFFSPVYGINTIGNLQVGMGYWIYVNSNCQLTYPAD
ncbi:MAG TPA: M14 family zinc carboxypeptidase [Candidatus Kapabacteria bacterium]|nr:M14 family zinc carboxypeptidase [Candidatus Kapabacteria bacterium]